MVRKIFTGKLLERNEVVEHNWMVLNKRIAHLEAVYLLGCYQLNMLLLKTFFLVDCYKVVVFPYDLAVG